ncbi:MAG TPA: nitrogenase component 1 [Negativicutes bacterium]|nr:nitrogenase component 1 [Negativicutes bacterium]
MAINVHSPEAVIRESRLGAITGYKGTIRELAAQASCGALKNRERCFTQTSACSSGCAQFYLSGIVDAAVVNHAPVGCAADAVYNNTANKWGEKIRGWKHRNINLISTNMTEEDTVFGAADKLRDAVREAYRRFAPKAIFVTTSCVSGIIGEDIKSVLDDLRAEVPVPLAPVFCEGFKSKVWASGFDAAFHAILTTVVKPPAKRTNKVNMINFRGSARETIISLLNRLDLEPVFIVPFSTVAELSKIAEACATISICGTLGGYLGNALEEQYGVPYVKTLQPHGVAGMDSWLRGLGAATGREAAVEEYIQTEKARLAPELAEIRAKLKGYKAVVGMGPSFGHNYMRVLQELGIEVVWGATWHFDQHYDHGVCPESTQQLADSTVNIPVSVCDQQNFELLNVLHGLKPDLYISRHGGTAVWATKMGIASVMVADEFTAFGYQGILDFGYLLLDAVTNRSLAKNLASRLKLPYTGWWLRQNGFRFLAEEVE